MSLYLTFAIEQDAKHCHGVGASLEDPCAVDCTASDQLVAPAWGSST